MKLSTSTASIVLFCVGFPSALYRYKPLASGIRVYKHYQASRGGGIIPYDSQLKTILASDLKKCHVHPVLKGDLNRPVKIFCAYFGHIYIFSEYSSYLPC